MFESLFAGKDKKPVVQTEVEAEAIIKNVQEQVKNEQPLVVEETPNTERDEPRHAPATVENVGIARDEASNPHGFTEIGRKSTSEEDLKEAA